MKKYILFTFVALSFTSTSQAEECSWENRTKYEVESCLVDLVDTRERDLKVMLARVNTVVVSQEEYRVSPNLSKDFEQDTKVFESYRNSFCNFYSRALGAHMGTGLYSTSLECKARVLQQRIALLRTIVK